MRYISTFVMILLLSVVMMAQTGKVTSVQNQPTQNRVRVVIDFPVGTNTGLVAGQTIEVKPATITPPPPVVLDCIGSWGTAVPVGQPSAWTLIPGSNPQMEQQTQQTEQTYIITRQAENGGTPCEAANGAKRAGPPIVTTRLYVPPTTTKIWGPVDTVADPNDPQKLGLLGTCSAQAHDQYVLPGPNNDGWFYRTWHPQTDNSALGKGCVYAHEHGDDPNSMTDAGVLANFDARFGLPGHNMKTMPGEPDGHVEAHEGFKIAVANKGEVNDDGFRNDTPTIAYNHMGTYRPKRADTNHHSHSISYRKDTGVAGVGSIYASYHLMADFTGFDAVCDPRVPDPSKDGMSLNQRCKVNSSYEIWRALIAIKKANGDLLYRGFATPAVFDVIGIINRLNFNEVIFAWDPRADHIFNFPSNDRSWHRGCERENYAEIGYYWNDLGTDTFWIDTSTGVISPVQTPTTTRARISQHQFGGQNNPIYYAGTIKQFKLRKSFCRPGLGFKN